MNFWTAGLAAGLVGWFLLAKENRALVAGKAYKATFRLTDGMPDLSDSQLLSILPPGAGITVPEGSRTVVVTFVAPRSTTINDIPTPLGTLKLISLQEMG